MTSISDDDRAHATALVNEVRNTIFKEGPHWSWLLRWFNDIAATLQGDSSNPEALADARDLLHELYTMQRGISEFYIDLPTLPGRREANRQFRSLLDDLRSALGM